MEQIILKPQVLYIKKEKYEEALTIDCPIGLAPMAGISDKFYRQICLEWGAGFTTTELVSAKGIRHKGLAPSYKYLDLSENESIPCIQLFGYDSEDFILALEKIFDHPVLSRVKIIDINMGCPVPKVCKTGAGAFLMKTSEKATEIVKACQSVCFKHNVPVTVKFRKGYDQHESLCEEFTLKMAEAGVAAITIHGRTRAEMYSGEADWYAIGRAKKALDKYIEKEQLKKIPLFVNGDISSVETAIAALRISGADGLQVGRAAKGNPVIFYQLRHALQPTSTHSFRTSLSTTVLEEARLNGLDIFQKIEIAYNHYNSMLIDLDENSYLYKDEKFSLAAQEKYLTHAFRKNLLMYLQGVSHASSLKKEAMQVENSADLKLFFQKILSYRP